MNKERLKNGLEKMGIAADETALDRFEAFHAILDEYNARMDLTAVLDEDERVDRHDLDSAAPLAHGLLMPGAKVIDVGTGAGFPGMPLLILRPDLQMTFLDALNKRILFLEDALARLGLKAETLHARAEDAAKMAPIPGRDDWAHVLLLTDKTGTTPKAYPRKAGTPNRKPLGQ